MQLVVPPPPPPIPRKVSEFNVLCDSTRKVSIQNKLQRSIRKQSGYRLRLRANVRLLLPVNERGPADSPGFSLFLYYLNSTGWSISTMPTIFDYFSQLTCVFCSICRIAAGLSPLTRFGRVGQCGYPIHRKVHDEWRTRHRPRHAQAMNSVSVVVNTCRTVKSSASSAGISFGRNAATMVASVSVTPTNS